MKTLHIANTFFEWELQAQPHCSLTQAFQQHLIYRQLQFLPILYGNASDAVLLFDIPEESYLKKLLEKGFHPPKLVTPAMLKKSDPLRGAMSIESWGPSRLIAEFARENNLIYSIPDWQIVRQVNSKQFSFELSPKLEGSQLLYNEKEAKSWLKSFQGKKVLKTCYGLSGKGHLIIDDSYSDWNLIRSFLQKQWDLQLPIIAEPWVERLMDFSTQWSIQKDKTLFYIGATLCSNTERGQYQFNTVGEESLLFDKHISFLREHIKIARPILLKIADLGFFGSVGIDAMIYKQSDNWILHPIVEINARKTMGWVALTLQKKYYPNQTIRFLFSKEKDSLLPEKIANEEKVHFYRTLTIYREGFKNWGMSRLRILRKCSLNIF